MKKGKSLLSLITFIVFLSFQISPLPTTTSVNFLTAPIASAATTSAKEITIAEKAVKKLEDNQTRENLTKAQNKLSKVSNIQKKKTLQHRIDLVEQAIIIKEAQAAVKYLEDNQSTSNVTDAKNKTALVTDEGTRANLTNRIALVEQAIIIKEAQAAVKYLEDNQSTSNVTDAKKKTALVTDEGTRADLTNRIALVENAIAAKETAATENATAAQEDRIVYVTGGGKSNVYWYSTDSMPWNTNMNNIVQMKESEAIAAGKRHSLTEP
ncbi:hypothetical protein [Streptococcus orisasini]|uniref:hypothetical protein n=1 Tax=Streptococcus orisasini TaxID=1080071 RepID=UPI000710719A|nr:hypothetical protein [Streptococcus orisasini]